MNGIQAAPAKPDVLNKQFLLVVYVETARSTTATTVAVTTASATSTAQSWRVSNLK